MAQHIRLFSCPNVFENCWHPHFTLLNPSLAEEENVMASRLSQLFEPYRQRTIESVCLLIQRDNDANWQIYREFHR